MSKSLVISLIGNDCPGIVESVAAVVLRHQGEWIESRMANLSGKFAGILSVKLPEQEYEGFCSDLQSTNVGLQISIEEVDGSQAVVSSTCYKLQLVGQDRPGIVHRITAALSAHGATVDDMETEVCEATMSGETLFKASITLCLAEGRSIDELSEVLEDLANELIVDIELG
jgi:glycine cleavage system regulatory protein